MLAPGAVGGTWTLTGPVRPSPFQWTPGDGFTGTWNDPNTITLTLNAVDGSGRRATRSITFVVE